MTSRLYRTTSLLYRHVWQALARLQIRSLGTPTLAVLIAWVVTGLILLEARQTQTRVARFLPGRCHDAHNRLLRVMPWSTRLLTALLIAFAKGLGQEGYLVLDEVIVEKAFAKRLPWAGSLYSFAKKRKVWGIQIIVLVWCSFDGQWRIPVGFRLWRPKRSCRPQRYQTKLELAVELVTAVVVAKLPVSYIVGDTHYTAGWFTKRLTRLGLTWHGTLDPKTIVIWRGKRQAVRALAVKLKLKWRAHLGLRAMALTVFAPKYGHLRLVVTRNRHGNYEYLVSNDQTLDLTTIVQRKRSRWSVEITIDEIKTHQRLRRGPLRSLKPVGVIQELYGLLIAHYIIRALMYQAAQQAHLDPDRLSFSGTIRVLHNVLPEFQMTAPEQLPALYQRLLRDIARKQLPQRRLRSNPRVVKRKMSNFKLKRAQHLAWPQPARSFRQAIEVKKPPTTSPFIWYLPSLPNVDPQLALI